MEVVKNTFSIILGLILILFFSLLCIICLASVIGILIIPFPILGVMLGLDMVSKPFGITL